MVGRRNVAVNAKGIFSDTTTVGTVIDVFKTIASPMFGMISVVLVLSFSMPTDALSAPEIAQRHVCLMDSYANIRGPYMAALVEQLAEQAGHGCDDLSILYCYDDPKENDPCDSVAALRQDFPNIRTNIIQLGDYNPISLQEHIENTQCRPNIVWVSGRNAFSLRYKLRISGMDRWIERHCAGELANCVYVGEAAGSICAGASLKAASSILCHDTEAAPEPQFFGLNLLGPKRTIIFLANDGATERVKKYKLFDEDLVCLKSEEVYVWSQSSKGDGQLSSVSSFVYMPKDRGMMAEMASPEPLPPIVTCDEQGVACFGEPSVDPSRQMQSSTIGDSEWIEGE